MEPNPSSRGWQGRYRYASHGLRFDVKRPTETLEDFQQAAGQRGGREEGGDAPQPETSADDRWYIGSRLRNSGSLHADIWTGTGAELADSGYIGITPVGGWWKENNRKDRAGLPVRYALLVSLQHRRGGDRHLHPDRHPDRHSRPDIDLMWSWAIGR